MKKKGKVFFLTVLGLTLFYALAGFVVIPWVITTQLPPKLSDQLKRPVSIQDARFNPFLCTLHVERFDVQEQDGSPLLGFDELFVDFEAMASLINQAYTFEEIRVGIPYGLAIVRPDGSLNFQELAHPFASSEDQSTPVPSEQEEPEGLPSVLIEHFAIQQGMVEFRDHARPTSFVAHLVPINLTLEQFSTQQGRANSYVLSAERSAGEKMNWEGTVTLEPFQSEGRLTLKNFILSELWEYVQDQFRFYIPQGQVTVNGHYLLTTTDQGVEVQVDEAALAIRDLQVQEKDSPVPVISLPLLEMTDVSVDVRRQVADIPMVKGRDARFTAWVGKDGVVNYQTLFSPVDEEREAQAHPEPEPEPSSASPDPWKVVIEDLAFDNFTIDFEDRQPETPVQLLLDELHFHTADVSLELERSLPVDLSFQINQTGKADVQGTLVVDPLAVDMGVSLANIALKPFQAYAAPYVQFDVENGALTLQGKTTFQHNSSDHPMATFQGGVEISQLILDDPMQDQSFLTWEKLGLQELDLHIGSTSVSLQNIELVNPSIVVLIDQDGGINLKRLFSSPGSPSEEGASQEEKEEHMEDQKGPPTPVQVASVHITDFLARFADLSITPNVVTQIEGLSGTIQGLSSEELARAEIDLEGTVDHQALLTIDGQINPLSEEAYTDLSVRVQDLSLPTVSPYAGKYVGYPITKGKLSLDLAYEISEHLLKGKNEILVDQLTMGEKVDSPDAVNLPIPLALALLKDRKGQITIDLPVRGNLDDPEFSYGGIIWNALVNLLTKAATSPFAMIGGLLGVNGEDLQYIAFPAGNAELPPAEQEKLQGIGKALDERPLLRLEIIGAADPKFDRQALAAGQLRAQLQKRKFVQRSPSSAETVAVDQIELSPEEEARLLSELYVEKFGMPSQPSSSEGKLPDLPTPQQMQAQLIEAIQVEEGQLRLLAQERAQVIQNYLTQEGNISGDRIFLVEPELHPETGEGTVRSPLSLTAG